MGSPHRLTVVPRDADPLAATHVVGEDEHGVAGGLLYTAVQSGSALGLSAVTAVHVAATAGSPGLDAVRSALLVPLVAALLGVLVVAAGRPLARRRRGAAVAPPARA